MTELMVQVDNPGFIACDSIKKAMLSVPGVKAVNVSKEQATITVMGYEVIRQSVLDKLTELGYPEKVNNSSYLFND
ncbi:MAG: heavy metal-associated domain-containing protein [Agriterribacter sp.]